MFEKTVTLGFIITFSLSSLCSQESPTPTQMSRDNSCFDTLLAHTQPSKLTDEQLKSREWNCDLCGALGGITVVAGISTTASLLGFFGSAGGVIASLGTGFCCGLSCFLPPLCYSVQCKRELTRRKKTEEFQRKIQIQARVDSYRLDELV